MSYRFCFGASGAGKSRLLQEDMIRRARAALETLRHGGDDTVFLYIVPEQYTMQTQKELVERCPDGGIMNIDVLSFGRLTHRIFEEVGAPRRIALDDVGKSLIIRRTAAGNKKQLSVIGSRIDRPGMVSEVKSMISEFMQYGIEPDDVLQLAQFAGEQGERSLEARLKDLSVVYRQFQRFEQDRFITGEETLDLLADLAGKSQIIKRSVIVFDGFTGFTPVQYRVLQALMEYAREVTFGITIPEERQQGESFSGKAPVRTADRTSGLPAEDNPQEDQDCQEQELFYLSEKTINDIRRYARYAQCPHTEDIRPASDHPGRFSNAPMLAHLEQNLFRTPARACGMNDGSISLLEASTPAEEVRQVCIMMRRLIREENYCYRDFGIVTGDLAGYEDEIRRQAGLYEIPVYIDNTRNVLSNPLTQAIRGALEIAGGDFTFDTVIGFLRSGLSDLTSEQVDLLENYCLAHGVRARRRWNLPFSDTEAEQARQIFLSELAPLIGMTDKSAGGRTMALYQFLVKNRIQEKMEVKAAQFGQIGDQARQKEYAQIYRALVDLLDQIYALLGEEMISAKEYGELIEAGLSEIRLGTLPQKVDRVLAGDIERTRMSQVRALFFLGVNDGIIPRSTSKGGLISDLDREFLQIPLRRAGQELSPTPRQQMYIQRLYLYLNMTKPTRQLVVSWSRTGQDGASRRPSYLINTIRQMFPAVPVQMPERAAMAGQLAGIRDTGKFLAAALRRYADGMYDIAEKQPEKEELLTIYSLYSREDHAAADRLTEAAFFRYRPKPISGKAAQLLYKGVLTGSVTRLEAAAQCYMKQFLQWGLGLKKRDEFILQPADTGTILHDSILLFSQKLQKERLEWTAFSKDDGRRLADEALREAAGTYRDLLLYDNARSAFMADRMRTVLERTVDTLQFQIRQGEFSPAFFEEPFGDDARAILLPGGGRLTLQGRVDRVDIAQLAGPEGIRTLLKIIDYKSGSRDLDEKQIRSGVQLQLMVYMDQMQKKLSRRWKGTTIEPAALLYYRFDDPVLTGSAAVIREHPGGIMLPDGTFAETPAASVVESAGEAPTAISAASADTGNSQRRKLEEARLERVRRLLRPSGLVSSDEEILSRLDHEFKTDSLVIPVKRLKDGRLASNSRTFDKEAYEELQQAAGRKIIELADNILKGENAASPLRINAQRTACIWCPYKDVCGFDLKLPGYSYRELK